MEGYAVKVLLNPKKLPFEVWVLGVIGFFLRGGLYAFGPDEKNLLPAFHPLEAALWLVTALTAALVAAMVWKLKGTDAYADNFRPSLTSAAGHILAACGILLTVLLNAPAMAGLIGLVWKLLGILSAPLLVWAAVSRARGKCPFFLTYGIPCVFFAIHLVCHYQTWCSDPQLQNYVFAFFGVIALMLFSYYQAAFAAGTGSRRAQLAAGLLAVYLCLVNLANTEYLFLYLGGALWAGTGLCRIRPRRKRKAGEENVSS